MEGRLRPSFPGLTETVVAALAGIPVGWRDRPLALCLSGGTDSSALAIVCAQGAVRERFPSGCEALHVRHRLRGAQSQGDADSVHELCGKLGLPLRILDAPVAVGPGLEARARAERYRVLRAAAPKAVLATAHHMDDQAETIILRLLRGAHVRGLAGIRPWREDGIWRPLLRTSRSDLERVCEDAMWIARLDSSNTDRTFQRNAIRLDLLPDWEKEAPGVAHALAQLAEASSRLSPALDRALDRLAHRCALMLDDRGFSLRLNSMSDPEADPELILLLERTWSRLGRRPWASQQLRRLISDAAGPGAGRRRGGQGEVAIWGGGNLRIERTLAKMPLA